MYYYPRPSYRLLIRHLRNTPAAFGQIVDNGHSDSHNLMLTEVMLSDMARIFSGPHHNRFATHKLWRVPTPLVYTGFNKPHFTTAFQSLSHRASIPETIGK